MAKKLFWIDLEMTGLDVKVHHIIEIAAVITDFDFKPLAEFHRVVFQPPEVLKLMDDWCVKTHGGSGLTSAIPNGEPLAEVERALVQFAKAHFGDKERIVLAGNSVWNDRAFIEKFMPDFNRHLHYRIVDVSSFKEIFREKYGIKVEKKSSHRAINDIYESINELSRYLGFVAKEKI